MHLKLAGALILAALSTTLINLAYLREHSAAAGLPPLSLRSPGRSVRLILASREWLRGFAMETTGFLMYAAALALASLALVQSVGAGGIGILAFVCARRSGQRLGQRRSVGVLVSVLGLLALAISLTGGAGGGTSGTLTGILAWMIGTVLAAAVVLGLFRMAGNLAVGLAAAGGLLFSVGDLSTKVATQGGARLAFVAPLIIGYGLGTSLLQLGYQRAGALTVAGVATLITNALPILAGTVVLHEPVPSGLLGVLRVLAFALVTAGAVLIASPRPGDTDPAAAPVRRPSPARAAPSRDPVRG